MDKPLIDQYKGKTIYIYHETFSPNIGNPYIICSYSDDGSGKFKLNKTELN